MNRRLLIISASAALLPLAALAGDENYQGSHTPGTRSSSSKKSSSASMGGWTGRGQNEEYLTKKEKKQLAKAIGEGNNKKRDKLIERAQRRKSADVRGSNTSDSKHAGTASSQGSHNPAGCGGGCQRSSGYN